MIGEGGGTVTFEEAHNMENDLRRNLEDTQPNHPALTYYPSTWKAIDAYYEALYGRKFFQEAGL